MDFFSSMKADKEFGSLAMAVGILDGEVIQTRNQEQNADQLTVADLDDDSGDDSGSDSTSSEDDE